MDLPDSDRDDLSCRRAVDSFSFIMWSFYNSHFSQTIHQINPIACNSVTSFVVFSCLILLYMMAVSKIYSL